MYAVNQVENQRHCRGKNTRKLDLERIPHATQVFVKSLEELSGFQP